MRFFKMDFNLVIAFLVCLTVKVSGQLPGLPPPGNLPIPQSIGTLPPIGTPGNVVPPTQNMAFTPANQPATSPPWMASAQSGGNIPTVPTVPPSTTSVVTFISVSGSFPSVSIPDNGYDDHYVTIKSMFDTYYPNVPPLRRVENRATLQIFQGSSGVAGTAVVSDDPTTIYIQYILPQQNAYAYLPFTTDSTRRLKYPERPIYLPYPQLAVRVPATGEIYPVYIPFQPNENRRNSEEPEMFIPSIVPGSNVPLYEAALPAQTSTFTTNNQLPSETLNGIQSSQPQGSDQNSRQIQRSGGTQQITPNAIGQPEMTSSNSGPQMSNFMLPLDGQSPKWNDLRVTWDHNATEPGLMGNPSAFAHLPLKESDAIIDGYMLLTDCSGSANFVGRRYWRNNDPALVLIYDSQGLIAGIQTGIPDNLPNGYPTRNLKPRPFVLEGNLLFVTAYFMEPSKICSSTRTEAQMISEGIGSGLYFQNGPNPLTDAVPVPSDESTIQQTLWGQGKCVPRLGHQYQYNVRKDMYCEELAPLHLMYDRGHLVAFAWFFVSDIQSPVFEKIPQTMYSRMFQTVPDCLYTMGQVTSLHIFLTDQYNEITCSAK
ncbi:uncharacterized protein LOC128182493 [Crassostrea angulata]|uniref:uncharacterized protein LOC128182493 n=1 Tax=Magallana angulata TaxID=2784310 RepID=UPI0022B0C668|nr:uncharacterized protein LOC128182493 [Crassostrea angulata]XP_052707091.1 uncharacterized protein LOC128182493 [Crassostrea angulata]